MFAAKTILKNAQKVKKYLLEKNLLDINYLPKKDAKFLYFPIKKKSKSKLYDVVNIKLKKKKQKLTLYSLLTGKLTKKELKLIPRSQEIVGDILILEIPEDLLEKEIVIANAYLKFLKNINTVVKKLAIHSGIFRTRKVKVLAGVKRKDTIHNESGVRLKLHLEKTYFSARLGHERLRIAKQVKKGEYVLVMFSGSAPYPLVLAKHSPAKSIIGVEINPDANNFGLENIKLNKQENKIKLIEGDVRLVLPTIRKKFNRILMPLPKTSEEFLDVALKKAKVGTIIHLYAFLNEKDIEAETKKIKKICLDNKHKVKVLRKVKCGQHAPYTFRVCYDLKVIS